MVRCRLVEGRGGAECIRVCIFPPNMCWAGGIRAGADIRLEAMFFA